MHVPVRRLCNLESGVPLQHLASAGGASPIPVMTPSNVAGTVELERMPDPDWLAGTRRMAGPGSVTAHPRRIVLLDAMMTVETGTIDMPEGGVIPSRPVMHVKDMASGNCLVALMSTAPG